MVARIFIEHQGTCLGDCVACWSTEAAISEAQKSPHAAGWVAGFDYPITGEYFCFRLSERLPVAVISPAFCGVPVLLWL